MSEELNKGVALATIQTVETDGLTLVFDGQTESDGKIYACNASIPFEVGDRVKCCEISGTWIAEYVVGNPNSRSGGTNYIPTGGAVGEVLAKKTAADFDMIWQSVQGGGDVDKLTNGNYNALLTSTGNLTPKSATVRGSLGTSAAKWHGLYASGIVALGDNTYSSSLSFFGAAQQAKLTLSTTSNNQGFTSVTSGNLSTTGVYVLNNIAGILKKYGLMG